MPSAGNAKLLAQEAQRLLSVGRTAEAEGVCRKLLKLTREHPVALMILGAARLAEGDLGEAEAFFTRGCAAHPQIVGFHAALARTCLQANRTAVAVDALERCVLLDPATRDHRVTLLALYQTRVFASFSEASKQAMLACLADDTLSHGLMEAAWRSLLRLDPEGTTLFELFDGATAYEAFAARLESTRSLVDAVHGYELLRRGLDRFCAADVVVERGLTFLRRWLFENRDRAEARGLPLLCMLGRYCFLTEYVFTTIEDHAGLRDELSSPAAVALLGCYEPLAPYPEATDWAALSDDADYRALLRTLVDEPLVECALAAEVAADTPIDDDISRAVQRQYEESPYPRWRTVGSGMMPAPEAAEHARDKEILIAGCGTGREAVDAAMAFPLARVTALDLSRASLAYGVRKARELGVANVRFAQADILKIGELPGRYDFIAASGVLHHMRDPRAGWRALLGILRPGGTMRVSLYSRLARGPVVEARAFIAAAGFPPTASGIREFRAAVMARPVEDPMRAWLVRSPDFYALSPCRDLVFHVHEQAFALPEIASVARDLGLSVVRVDVKSPVHATAYRDRFRGDPSATNLASWHRLEEENPQMFAGMYSLWFCRTAETDVADTAWLAGGGGGAQGPV